MIKMVELNDLYIKFQSVLASVELGMKVDEKHFTALASSEPWRISLYDSLKSMDRLDLFPKDFLSREKLGRSLLHEYASEEEEPVEIEYLGVRIAEYDGKRQEFLLYIVKFDIEEEDSHYLGVIGPFDPGSKEIEINRSVSGIFWEKIYSSEELKTLLEEYLKDVKEYIVE